MYDISTIRVWRQGFAPYIATCHYLGYSSSRQELLCHLASTYSATPYRIRTRGVQIVPRQFRAITGQAVRTNQIALIISAANENTEHTNDIFNHIFDTPVSLNIAVSGRKTSNKIALVTNIFSNVSSITLFRQQVKSLRARHFV